MKPDVVFEEVPVTSHAQRLRTRKVAGVGVVDVDYLIRSGRDVCPAYTRWKNMLRRVRDDDRYRGIRIDPRWHSLAAFKEWLETWSGWQSLEVDKDLLGKETYGPDACVMLPRAVNQRLANLITAWRTQTYPCCRMYRICDDGSERWRYEISDEDGRKETGNGFTSGGAAFAALKDRQEHVLRIIALRSGEDRVIHGVEALISRLHDGG